MRGDARLPRRHRFATVASPDELFRRLPAGHRFRFAAGARETSVMGCAPVRVFDECLEPGSGATGELPAAALREALPRLPQRREEAGFDGGAVGFVTYERGLPLLGLPARRLARPGPNLAFAVYDTFARWHPEPAGVEVVSWGLNDEGRFEPRLALERASALEEILRTPGGSSASPPQFRAGSARASLDREEHGRAVEAILDAIGRGDIYQADLTAQFAVDFEGDPNGLFERLLRDNPAPHSTLLEVGPVTVVSSSPETLLRCEGRLVESRPIKGTARRDPDPQRDRRLARALAASRKNAAELLMITDLMRNDLGRVCRFGTVRVPALQALESYPHVHHLVSTVRGELRRGLDVFDALAAVLPAGSITGTPKRRAVEILGELEPCPRDVYTGAIGWVGFDRSAHFSVGIRSGILADGVFSFGAGGGIVADSRPHAEWKELLLKAKGFAKALGLELEPTAHVRER